jgi:hypothetical protein
MKMLVTESATGKLTFAVRALTIGLMAVSTLLACGQSVTPPGAAAPAAAPQAAAHPDPNAAWQQDLQVLVDALSDPKTGQLDFAKLYPPATFDAAITNLKAQDLTKTSFGEVNLQLIQLIASAHVSHNAVVPQGRPFAQLLPLEFYWYSDGLAVTSATPEYADALGARVIKIGESTPDQLLPKLAPYIAYENDSWLRSIATQYLTESAFLRHLNLLGSDKRVAITLEKPGQPSFTISVALPDDMPKLVSFREALHVRTPFYLSNPSKYYWYQYLEDSKTFYIQYNRCENDPQQSFSDFTKQVLAEVDSHSVSRIVLDLRLNGGGDSSILAPLKQGLETRHKAIGHLYVLIGPKTFSSAMMNASDLHDHLTATLVGEPTGDGMNTYGNVASVLLPNFRIRVMYTNKFFGNKNAAPSTPQPDIYAPRTLASDLAGRDPALEAAIAAP